MIGPMKKAAWMRVMTRAIAVPAKRSRTMAWDSVRGPAAASPQAKRLAYSTGSDGASAATSAAPPYSTRLVSSTRLRPTVSEMGP